VVLNLSRRELVVFFQLGIFDNRRTEKAVEDTFHEYRLRVPFAQLTRLLQKRDNSSVSISHIIPLDAPPIYHRRLKDLSSTFSIREGSWRDEDAWFRQTDIVHVPEELARLPISLRKHKAIINIGRWTTIRINYPPNVDKQENFTLLCRVLRDFNVDIGACDDFSCRIPNVSPVPVIWDIINPAPESEKASFLDDLKSDEYLHLPFSVRYQLEVCLSHGYISEYAASKEFVEKLLAMGEKKAKILLEHIATEKRIYYDPMAIFDLKFVKGATTGKIPLYCCYMRSATITPSTVYYNTPSVDISNRVIRRFIEYSDRFLRVRFKDEKLEGRINSTERNTMDEVFTRIKRTMTNGITLGDRHYEFLAFGNSQFREHGAYFFASLPNLTAANIRGWMGQFEDIKNIAKYAARLGQCFSTTRAVTGCAVQVREISDVVRNGYTFSDGVGRVSRFLAQMAANELKIKTPDREPPSAFQFRLGGRKGMLVVSSEAQRQEIHIRPSQHKFPAGHNGLEIIRWSQFSMATLNRQLIIVLSSLGVSDEIFHQRLRMMLANLDEAMTSEARAVHLLQKYVDPNQMTLFISQMVKDGFQKSKEPFVTSLLALWRAWQIKYLKEKAKIVIDSGACILGVMDETGTLKGYSHDRSPNRDASYEEKVSALPEIFLQISRPDQGGKYQVIEGICILARNPSLHPGDIRVVKAVNIPQLRRLKDVVVLPQLGDRDISSMCSGGDLDGDDYLVIWDKDLLPNDWFRKPMDYTATKAKDLDRPVTVNDVTSFFVTYMKNDCLPRIAHAHLAWADRLHGGVEENKCMRLAKLHSDAVDYNKTGSPAKMTRDLRPRMWPHFMEKKHQPKDRIYKSHKILGQLYDSVERVDFVPNLEMPFDQRILNCEIKVDEDLMHFAKQLKHTYDLAVRRIMAQHEIGTEFEIWSTFVLSHANVSKDYKFHEELGGISSSLRDRFRKECYDKVGGRQFERVAPLAVAMYHVTCNEVTVALAEFQKDHPASASKVRLNPDKLPLISFPWILPDILGKIALGYYDEKDEALVGRKNKEQQPEDQCQTPPEGPSGSDESIMEGEIVVLPENEGAGITTAMVCRPEDSFEGEEEAKDIVEEEGDVKPSALDMLENLLEDSDED
jgi:RNA-dependent RNA polymerase